MNNYSYTQVINLTSSSPYKKFLGKQMTDLESIIKPIKTDKDTIDFTQYKNVNPITITTAAYDEPAVGSVTSSAAEVIITVSKDTNFNIGDYIFAQGVYGYESNGTTLSSNELQLVITNINRTNHKLTVTATNGKKIGSVTDCIPSIPAQTKIINLGGSVDEDDISAFDYERIDKIVGFRYFNIELPYSNNIELDMAINYFNRMRDASYIKQVLGNSNTFEGLWNQAGAEYVTDEDFEDPSSGIQEYQLSNLLSEAMYGNDFGGGHKICLASTSLLYVIDYLTKGENIIYNGAGSITFLYSPAVELVTGDGSLIIDPKDISIYTKEPKKIKKSNGVVKITETSNIILRHPKQHMRIIRA